MKDPADMYRQGVNLRELADKAEAYQPKANGKGGDTFSVVRVSGVEPTAVNWL